MLLIALLNIVASYVSAAEVPANADQKSKGDWSLSDRIAWTTASRNLNTENLKVWVRSNSDNTFLSAALFNTKSNQPGEYRSIRERNAYYDYISFAIETQDIAPLASRGVRFFHAATSVTIQGELGMAESITAEVIDTQFPTIAKKWGVTTRSLNFISDVNKELFARNMRVIRDLMFIWKTPLDPRAAIPHQPITSIDFDLAMVEFEQTAVQAYITRNAVTNSVLTDVTSMIKRGQVFTWLGMTNQVKSWLKAAGFKENFSDYRWRVALGRAIVFLFHKKSQSEYLDYMNAHPPIFRTRPVLYSGLLSPEKTSKDTIGNFTILGSWKTENRANHHADDLRKKHLGIDIAVYPPYGKDIYWTVVAASFAPATVAYELRDVARKTRIAADAYVLHRVAIDNTGKPVLPSPLSLNLAHTPDLLKAATADAVPEATAQAVSIFSSMDKGAVEARLNTLKTSYPDLSLGLFQIKSTGEYSILLASYANDQQIEQALAITRRLAIANSDVKVHTFTNPNQLEHIGTRRTVQTTWAIVKNCYKSGSVTIETLQKCSGYWVTPSTLTRCILESDCRLLNNDDLPTNEQIQAFLHIQGLKLTDELKIDETSIPVAKDAKALTSNIQDCRNQAQGDEGIFISCMTAASGDSVAAAALKCQQNGMTAQAVLDCISSASGQVELQKVNHCIDGDSQNPIDVTKCLLGPSKTEVIDKAMACFEAAKSQTAALSDCASKLLEPSQAAKVTCLTKASSDPIAAATCTLPPSPERSAALHALNCTQYTNDTRKAAECIAGLVDNGAARVVQCATSNYTKVQVIECMLSDRPEIQQAAKVLSCVSNGTDPASLIGNCSDGVLDAKTALVTSCVAQHISDASAMAGCAASSLVPQQFGPVFKCAASSTGGTDSALCLIGPQLSAEWRIAAECAVQSGGVAPAFATCAAGRLTIRELTKCLTGTIGKDCFGPNNTIVAAFATVANDLSNCYSGGACLGPDNDLVKAGKDVERFIGDLGNAAGQIWDSFTRGDIGKTLCNCFGC
ncbi:hypothetical protein ACNPN6_15270 [Enterobacter quasiroggenkampii]|uniref:hypothetical protein n=1 Tax=Enterobacter quasiroggenkampii TaxID=2497436 RepID=UPI003AAF360F